MKEVTIHRSNNVKGVGVVIIVISFILAIAMGYIAATPSQEYLDHQARYATSAYKPDFRGEKSTFNISMAFGTLMAGALSSMMFFVIGAMIDRQNAMIGILIKLHKGLVKEEEDQEVNKTNDASPYDDYYQDSSR